MTKDLKLSSSARVTVPRSNDKRRIIEHYDVVSPYYRSLWGEHLHHGYWIGGEESKEKAQVQLIEHLAHNHCEEVHVALSDRRGVAEANL